jgi:F0F1-type ATP synthase delta subunit
MRLAITFNYNYLRQQIEDCFESDEYETNDGVVINEQMLRTCLKYLTASDVKEMLEWVCESINEPSYYDLVHEILDNKLTNNLYQIVEQLNKEEINTQQG